MHAQMKPTQSMCMCYWPLCIYMIHMYELGWVHAQMTSQALAHESWSASQLSGPIEFENAISY